MTTPSSTPPILTGKTAAPPLVLSYDADDPPEAVELIDQTLDAIEGSIETLRKLLRDPPLHVAAVAKLAVWIGVLASALKDDGDGGLADAAREQAVAEHAARHARTPASGEVIR